MKLNAHYIAAVVLAFASAVLVAGCGGGGGGGSDTPGPADGEAMATVVLANTSATRTSLNTANIVSALTRGGGGPVDISEIESLTLTITEIELQLCEDDDEEEEGEVVLVMDSEFDPASVEIEQGETVRWVWTTDTEHTITSGSAGDADAGSLFDESASGAGSIVELTFADTGAFPYFSNFEDDIAAGMAGVVQVEPDDDGDDEDRSGARSNHRGDDDDGDNGDDDGESIVIFSGSFDVDLLDLTELSQVLTEVEVPAGEYCGIRLRIENPRLVLVSDPDTIITNVHLTANGRLFVKEHFEIDDEEEVLIILDFGGIHLVRAGNSGKYVLTPHLKADIDIVDAAVSFQGEIIAIDAANQIIQVQTDVDTREVAIDSETVISSDDDADDAADTGIEVLLAFEDLAVGQTVMVDGLLTVAGPIDGNSILIADEDIVTNETAFDGSIVAVDAVTSVIQVQSGAETIDVAVGAGAVITTDDDADDAADTGATVALVFGDLVIGQTVSIEGLVITGAPIDATAILVEDASIDTAI